MSDPTPPPNAEPTAEEVRETLAIYTAEQPELRWSSEAGMRAALIADRARRPSPPAVAFDEAGIEALRNAYDAAIKGYTQCALEPHTVALRAVAPFIAEAAFAAVERSGDGYAQEHVARAVLRSAIAEARRSLRIPTPVEAPIPSIAEPLVVCPGCGSFDRIDGHSLGGWDCGACRRWFGFTRPEKTSGAHYVAAPAALARRLLPPRRREGRHEHHGIRLLFLDGQPFDLPVVGIQEVPMTAAAGARYVVRSSERREPLAGWYRCTPTDSWRDGLSPCQSDAIRYDVKLEAERAAKRVGGRVVRLVSRAEAVERMRQATILVVRNEVYGLKHLDDKAGRPASISNPYQAALADVLNRLQDLAEKETGR